MSQQATSVLDPARSVPTVLKRIPVRWAVAGAILAAAFLPLLIAHGQRLWMLPHYQFFPLALIGAAVLAWPAIKAGPRSQPGSISGGISYLLVAVSWLALAFAVVIESPWLASVACLLLLTAVPLGVGGWPFLRGVLPALVYLLLIIPPPLGLDARLVGGLQTVTAKASSRVLDFIGVYHSMAGNVVETAGERYMVEEACSGIQSLFSMLAVVLFCIFWAAVHWLRALCLIMACFFWVLVQNVTRVVLVTFVDVRWGEALASWRIFFTEERAAKYDYTFAINLHYPVDFVLFGISLLLLLSTDRFLRFLGETFTWREETRAAQARVTAASTATAPQATAARWLPAGVLGGIFAILAIPQLADLALGVSTLLGSGYAGSALIDGYNQFEAKTLPAEIEGWRQKDVDFAKRDSNHILGEFSRMWTYEKNGLRVILSFDFPFPIWHDLRGCYESTGWKRDGDGDFFEQTLPGHDAPFHCCQMSYSRPIVDRGYLWFTEFDQHGDPVRPALTRDEIRWGPRLEKLRQSWQHVLGLGGSAASQQNAVLQVQVFHQRFDELRDSQREDIQNFFLRGTELLRNRCLELRNPQ